MIEREDQEPEVVATFWSLTPLATITELILEYQRQVFNYGRGRHAMHLLESSPRCLLPVAQMSGLYSCKPVWMEEVRRQRHIAILLMPTGQSLDWEGARS